jgi:hypothetical protein
MNPAAPVISVVKSLPLSSAEVCSSSKPVERFTGNATDCALYLGVLPVFPGAMKSRKLLKFGEPCWVRTSDLLIKSQLLYRLS